MIRPYLKSLCLLILFSFLCPIIHAEETNFAEKTTIEIGGSATVAYYSSSGFVSFSTFLGPSMRYYFLEQINIGIEPNFGFGYTSSVIGRNWWASSQPILSIGYTFSLKEKLFLDLSPHIGTSIIFSEQPIYPLIVGLTPALKLVYGTTIVSIGLRFSQFFYGESGIANYTTLALNISLSTFF